jgi:DUF4097 and DUF4098 domain-containing protein YvlB
MPTFATPEPIAATVDVGGGHVHIVAGDRTDTVVDVQPANPNNRADVELAGQSRVEYAAGRLSVTAPKHKSWRALIGRPGSIDVTIELPEHSQVDVQTWSDVLATGRLGEAAFASAIGAVQVEEVGRLKVRTATGDVTVVRAAGPADVSTSTGKVRLGAVEGAAVVKTASGDIVVGEVTGDVRVVAGRGDLTVEQALAGVEAKTGAGAIRIGEVVEGKVVLKTGLGPIEVGVREGTSAWLDISTSASVRSELAASAEPGPSDRTVEVRASTGWGDVLIRRAAPSAAADR